MKMFANSVQSPVTTLQLFKPDARAVYSLEAAASLTQLPAASSQFISSTDLCRR